MGSIPVIDGQHFKVPEFYCCYLLQSICKSQSFYVGSTPNPVRRLRQHNGILTRGGAYRTKRVGTRPWQMIVVVHGFPSKVAALQFEHAWQHSYKTHYIEDVNRVVKNKNGGRSIHHRLATVRLLLSHVYFQHMGLTVEFFNRQTREIWNENKFGAQGGCLANVSTVPNALGVADVSSSESIDVFANANLALVETFYEDHVKVYRSKFEMYKERLAFGQLACEICDATFDYTSDDREKKPLVGFCTSENCKFVSHLRCLHRYFTDDVQLLTNKQILVPKTGKCPNCSTVISWKDVVTYSTAMKASYG
ncbi:hypothetical protein HG537_0G03570 [Torulaspora globosa]|uniref:GIY-YIG domain-containing protein n=1 Tax=Torulaspora globosa TaxID=48254 RepID=A0A7H9I025_9SACH|nr:hypothetical protein HG537_0G03570 [Torulaspora sp. CBS 2947]